MVQQGAHRELDLMAKAKKKPAKKRSPPLGAKEAMPFKDVVQRLLDTPPDPKRSR